MASADTLTLWGSLPQFVQDADTANGLVFQTWLDAVGQQLQVIDDLARDQGSEPGWAIVLDVTQCPTYALPWLAQFVGVRFNASQQTDAAMRAAISAESEFARGTVAAIEAAGNAQLMSNGTAVLERTPDPYSLTIVCPAADVAGGSWAELVAGYATWAVVVTDFATWAAVDSQTTAFEQAVLAAVPGGIVVSFTFD